MEVDIIMIMSPSTFCVGHISTCRRATSGAAWYRRRVVSLSCTFQRAVLVVVWYRQRVVSHFGVQFNAPQQWLCLVQTAGRVTFSYSFQRAVLATLRGTDNRSANLTVRYQRLFVVQVFACLLLLMNIVYLPIYSKLRMVVGMTNKCQR